MNRNLFVCKRRASDVGAAEMVVAAVKGIPAHTSLCQFQTGTAGALEWAATTTLTTASGAGLVGVAGKIAELLLTYSKRPSDVYFDLFVIEDFFDTEASDYGISLSNVASRVRCVETALAILLENRRLWAMASDHLLATGAMTFTDAQTYLASCSGDRRDGHSAILALSRESAI